MKKKKHTDIDVCYLYIAHVCNVDVLFCFIAQTDKQMLSRKYFAFDILGHLHADVYARV